MPDVRLIDANAAKKALTGWFETPTDEDVEYAIDKQPTIDAVPVVHGRWNEPTGRFQDGFWVCSCCNFCTEAIAAVQLYKYCPNCGAKMDGGAEG